MFDYVCSSATIPRERPGRVENEDSKTVRPAVALVPIHQCDVIFTGSRTKVIQFHLCAGQQMQPVSEHGKTERVDDPNARHSRRRARVKLCITNLVTKTFVAPGVRRTKKLDVHPCAYRFAGDYSWLPWLTLEDRSYWHPVLLLASPSSGLPKGIKVPPLLCTVVMPATRGHPATLSTTTFSLPPTHYITKP